MVSVKVKFRKSTKDDREGVIYYQILHRRVPRQISTAYRIRADEWNEKRSLVMVGDTSREAYLMSVRDRIHWDIERLQRIIRRMANGIVEFTSEDIVEEFRRYSTDYSFIHYMENTIASLIRNGKIGTAENYRSALNSFRKFMASCIPEGAVLGEDDVMLDCITSELMERYEAWHLQQGHVPNTISFYMRIFRAVYKRAVDENIIEDLRPFKRVYTGVDKTEKRAIPLHFIRKIKALDLTMKPDLDHARDVFMLSFYLRGMSFIDLCFLRKTDLAGGGYI